MCPVSAICGSRDRYSVRDTISSRYSVAAECFHGSVLLCHVTAKPRGLDSVVYYMVLVPMAGLEKSGFINTTPLARLSHVCCLQKVSFHPLPFFPAHIQVMVLGRLWFQVCTVGFLGRHRFGPCAPYITTITVAMQLECLLNSSSPVR